jgi:hypothetical protein
MSEDFLMNYKKVDISSLAHITKTERERERERQRGINGGTIDV